MVILSLGSTGYLYLYIRFMSLAHPEKSFHQTTRRSMDDTKFITKDQENGGSKMRLFETTKSAIDSPTPHSEV